MENLYNKEIADAEMKLVRCRECRHKDTEFCRVVWKTKYDLKKSMEV